MWSFLLTLSILFFAAAGMFYSAGSTVYHGNAFAHDVCSLAGAFCDHPDWLMFAGGVCLFVALFMRIFVSR